jgi:ABC-type transporter Mla subunit MlaD
MGRRNTNSPTNAKPFSLGVINRQELTIMTKILFGLLLTMTFVGCFSEQNKYTISFDRVDGLQEGSSVLNRGLTIGKVTHIDLFGNRILVDIELNTKTKIPEQSTFLVRENLLGSSYIDIEYSDKMNFLSSKDTILGKYQKRAIMDNIISDTTKRKKIEKSLEKIASGIGELIETAKDSTKKQSRITSRLLLRPTLGLALLGLDEYMFSICSLLCFSSGLTL